MEEIDRPFRPTLDFCTVWALLFIPAYFYRKIILAELPWYSHVAYYLVVPFTGTFFVYGPALLLKQVVRSGSRGWFVFRVFLTIVLTLALFLVISITLNPDHSIHSRTIAFVSASIAIIYLHWRIDRK